MTSSWSTSRSASQWLRGERLRGSLPCVMSTSDAETPHESSPRRQASRKAQAFRLTTTTITAAPVRHKHHGITTAHRLPEQSPTNRHRKAGNLHATLVCARASVITSKQTVLAFTNTTSPTSLAYHPLHRPFGYRYTRSISKRA